MGSRTFELDYDSVVYMYCIYTYIYMYMCVIMIVHLSVVHVHICRLHVLLHAHVAYNTCTYNTVLLV